MHTPARTIMQRTPKCTATIMIPSGLISPMGYQTRATLLRYNVSLFLRSYEWKSVSCMYVGTYVECTRIPRRVVPLFFFETLCRPGFSHSWLVTKRVATSEQKMECGVYQIYLPTSKGDRRNLVRFPYSLLYFASLIGDLDIRKSLPAEDNIILRRWSYYCTLCANRFAKFHN